MAEFLLELLCEEIPARMQKEAAENLRKLFCDQLTAASLPFTNAAAHVTPRRLAFVVQGLPLHQPDALEERKGPKVGSPEGAIQGFLKGAGLDSLGQAEQRDTGKGVFWFAVTKRMGRPTEDILEEITGSVITQFPWPKSMRWSAHRLNWVRPLHNILMVLDGKPVVARIEFGPTLSYTGTHWTVGHRFLSPERFEVTGFEQYKAELHKRHVILNREERKAEIFGQLEEAVTAAGLRLVMDEKLLEEVTGLVEWPTVLLGRIDPEYMDLPPEVRQLTMRVNQRYFTLEKEDGTSAPWFALVANVPGTVDDGRTIVAGNERVLRARLSDARFFRDQDLKTKLESRLEALETITFHARLGHLRHRAERLAELARALALSTGAADRQELAYAAGRLAKADLVTGMVGEFPELQGLIGGYYARAEGQHEDIATAIADHYRPAGPSDRCPSQPVAIAVALADKLDTLVGFFAIDELPTGSRDPYALRRAAIGIFRLIRENGLRLDLEVVIGTALEGYQSRNLIPEQDAAKGEQIFLFIVERVKVFLREQGTRPDHIEAALIAGDRDLTRILARSKALQQFLGTPDGENLLTGYNRAAKILHDETGKDPELQHALQVYEEALREPEEQDLWKALKPAAAQARELTREEKFEEGMALLAKLRQPIDTFFERVLINDPDQALRRNRLSLLEEFVSTINAMADFSRIIDQ